MAIMGGPIPNSLGAGGANLTFIGHGSVTFAFKAIGVVVGIINKVCLNAELVTLAAITGGYVNSTVLEARKDNVKVVTGLVEDC